MALQQSKGGQEGSYALRTAILIPAVAGNRCKLKPDADASNRIPPLTVGRALGKGSGIPAVEIGPHQLGRSRCSKSLPGASSAVNCLEAAQPASQLLCLPFKKNKAEQTEIVSFLEKWLLSAWMVTADCTSSAGQARWVTEGCPLLSQAGAGSPVRDPCLWGAGCNDGT